MLCKILVVSFALASSSVHAAGHIDQTDADITAIAVIEAFRAQDGPTGAGLLNDTNARMAPMLSALPVGDPEWDALWSSWRQAGLDVWGGKNLPARDRDGDGTTAIVPFAFDGPDGAVSLSGACTNGCRYLLIVLTRDSADDTTWGFEDINGAEITNYDSAGPLN